MSPSSRTADVTRHLPPRWLVDLFNSKLPNQLNPGPHCQPHQSVYSLPNRLTDTHRSLHSIPWCHPRDRPDRGAMKAVADHHHGFHSSPPPPETKISIPVSTGGGAEVVLLGKGRYRAWALAAIALLALWSMFAASVSLRWSSGDLASSFGDASDPLLDDLDPLEMEEREKLVRRMWDVYTRTGDRVRLPRFWQEAFEAAYEELAGDDTQASVVAVSEIARMSIHRPELEQSGNKN